MSGEEDKLKIIEKRFNGSAIEWWKTVKRQKTERYAVFKRIFFFFWKITGDNKFK